MCLMSTIMFNSIHRTICKDARETVKGDTTVATLTSPPMSRDYAVHYSFDYAQQVTKYIHHVFTTITLYRFTSHPTHCKWGPYTF